MKNKKKLLFWTSIGLLGLGFIASKFIGLAWVSALFDSKNFTPLNAVAGCQTICAKEFYLGQFEDIIFGPLSIFCAGFLFLLICLRYRKKLSPPWFGVTVFAYFLITKFDTFLFPPYGDSASGPCMEAVWLLRNNFNYFALHREALFVHGGPKAYLTSLYPTYLALLMKILPGSKIFLIVNHLITMVLSTVIIVVFRKIAEQLFSKKESLLIAIFFMALPIYQSQSEQINMEIPILIFLILSFYYLGQKRFFYSAWTAGLAGLIKVYAVYMGISVFIVSLFEFFTGEKRKIKTLLSGFFALMFAAFGAYTLFFLINTGIGKADKIGFFQGWHLIKKFPVTYVYLISLGVYLGVAFRFIKRRSLSFFKGFIIFIQENYLVSTMVLVCAGWFALFLNSAWIAPRYTLILLPSLLIVVFGCARFFIKSEKVFTRVLIALILFSFLSSYGLVYKAITIQDYAIAERSLEYRNDIRLHIRLGKLIEDKYSNFTIAAPFNFAQMYGFPEIGFVNKQLDVMIFLFPCTYGNIKNFDGIQNLNIRKIIWIGVKTPFIVHPLFPIGPHDRIIESLSSGNKSAQLFLGGFSIDKVYHSGQAFMKLLKEKGFKNKIDQP
ncbi:MAG: hypothetical protein P9M07_03435 [Candidatus Aceula meridiana]|nr:hypothetical protein [Candidatus Aceula meridiana]